MEIDVTGSLLFIPFCKHCNRIGWKQTLRTYLIAISKVDKNGNSGMNSINIHLLYSKILMVHCEGIALAWYIANGSVEIPVINLYQP